MTRDLSPVELEAEIADLTDDNEALRAECTRLLRTAPHVGADAAQEPTCNFCGRCSTEARILLVGRDRAFICDVCILLAMHALVDKFTTKKVENG